MSSIGANRGAIPRLLTNHLLCSVDMSMKEIASWALNTAKSRGASFCDLRIVDERNRSLATKNGKVGHASASETLGIGIRVIADGSWGFAATDDLTRESVERTAAQAVSIARSSATVKQYDVALAPEKAAIADWESPCAIDPFGTSVEDNIALLLAVDKELTSVKGVTLAEANLNFRRYEQWFYSSEGAEIHQTRTTTGGGFAAFSFLGTGIPKRAFPNFFSGQFHNKGYKLIGEPKIIKKGRRPAAEQGLRADRRAQADRECAPHRRRSGRVAFGAAVSARRGHHRARFLAAGIADTRVGGASHRTRPRARHGGELCGHVLPYARQVAQ